MDDAIAKLNEMNAALQDRVTKLEEDIARLREAINALCTAEDQWDANDAISAEVDKWELKS